MIYLFNKSEQLIKVLTKEEIKEATQIEQLNSLISLEVTLKKEKYKILKEAEYIAHFDYNNKEKFTMYKILKNDVEQTSRIDAVHVVFDELKSNGYIRDKRPDEMEVSQALQIILDGTRWEVGNVYCKNKGSSNWYDKTRLDALSDLINKWNVELDYRLEFDGHKITKRYIDIYSSLGTDTGKRFTYGCNALNIKAEENKQVYTALIGRGKGEEKFDEDGKATGGYGRKINFKEVEWKKSEGKPLDKPAGQEFIEDEEATKLYGFADGKPRIRIAEYSECEDPEELLNLTYNELQYTKRPRVLFSSTVRKIGNVGIGDTVRIIRKELDLYYFARVRKIERDLLDNNRTNVELGDYIESSLTIDRKRTEQRIADIENTLREYQEVIEKNRSNFIKNLQEGLKDSYFNEDGFNYEFQSGNEYGLPAGYYSFNKPIDEEPDKVIYFGAGKFAIANSKDNKGQWQWRSFGTGDGFVADVVNAGTLKGGNVKWNLEDGTFLIGESESNYLMKFDGRELIFGTRALTKESMTDELKEELKGKPGKDGEPGEDGKPGKDGTDATLPEWWHNWNKTTTTINGDYILTPRIYVGGKYNNIVFGNKVYKENGYWRSGLAGINGDKLLWRINEDGSARFGYYDNRQLRIDTNGNLYLPSITVSDIEDGAITTTKIKGGAITTSKIDSGAITSDKIDSGAITASKIDSGAITSDKISSGAITAGKISSGAITADKISSGAITTDMLFPGTNNRIVLERGYSPGSNNCKSIDANGGAIRLKVDSDTYISMRDSGIVEMYSRNGQFFKFDPRESWRYNGHEGDGWLVLHDAHVSMGWLEYSVYSTRSDRRLKENIKYIKNKQKGLNRENIYDFIKSVDLATYRYKKTGGNNISMIAQDIEEFKFIKDYLVGKNKDGIRLINTGNYISMIHIALQEEIKKNKEKDEKIKKLENDIEMIKKALNIEK